MKVFFAFLILFTLTSQALAYVASSTNYRIQTDSLNFAGGNSTSTNYTIESTLGEIASGTGTSTNYQIKAGYQQMLVSSISVSAPSNVTMSPAITGPGTATGQAAWTVITDNPAGYTMTLQSSASPAFTSGSDSFDDYTPAGASPDYTWSVAGTVAEFGFTVEGSDTASRYLDNGSTCAVGASNSSDTCWDALSTSAVTIASDNSSNTPAGTATTVKLQAEVGATKVQPTGTYSATLTVTATAL